MRVFLAVPSDPLWADSARGLVESLSGSLPRASWTRAESWHLTLLFLGDVSGGFGDRFAEAVAGVAFETVAGEIQAAPPVVFPEHGRPRVLGVGFAPSPGVEALGELAAVARRIAMGLGWREESHKAFHPHVTFARIREPWSPAAVADYRRAVENWRFPSWLARSCVLFESRLDPSGAVHTPLHEWTFQGGPRGVRA